MRPGTLLAAGTTALALVVTACGQEVTTDGSEVVRGEGEYDVVVHVLQGAPEGWTAWTELTEQTGMLRHVALRPVGGGWSWVTLLDLTRSHDDAFFLGLSPAPPAEAGRGHFVGSSGPVQAGPGRFRSVPPRPVRSRSVQPAGALPMDQTG